jgi:asparagine synthase (glutamine-hydrolysing)
MGFGVPLDHWYRDEQRPLLHDILLDTRAANRGYFRTESVRQLIDEHQSGRWDHSYRLWALICFERWHRTFVDRAAVA